MIQGLGIDIIEIERIKQSVEQNGERFLNKIFTPNELEYCLGKTAQYQHLAARWAAKEAVAKALAEHKSKIKTWQDVEILNDENGAPFVRLCSQLDPDKTLTKQMKISISHCHDYATCVAIFEG